MTAGSISVPHIIPLRFPGPDKPKAFIDSNTYIAIKSDTPEVLIYFSVDGSKPELLKKPGHNEMNAMKYKGPFTLNEGKRTVKAMAVTRDGRESGVVTKVFLVEYAAPQHLAGPEDNAENFLLEYQADLGKTETLEGFKTTTDVINKVVNQEQKSAWGDTTQKMKEMTLDGSRRQRPRTGKRIMEGGPISPGRDSGLPFSHSSQSLLSDATSPTKTLVSSQTLRLQKELEYLKCPKCLAARPSDPFALFCQECGCTLPPVPGPSQPPPKAETMILCLSCKSMVPTNTPNCIVCEVPIPGKTPPQASKDIFLCKACGTGNPANVKHCVTCETRLPETPMAFSTISVAPPPQTTDKRLLNCSKCGRLNNSDARFCDWCGAKPSPPVSYLACTKCGATSHSEARFCGTCGTYLDPPARLDAVTSRHGGFLNEPLRASWQMVSLPLVRASFGLQTADQATQTVGLFYPSGRGLEQKVQEVSSKRVQQDRMSDRRPPITAVSPGKGYWRKQIDHVCAHLRSYTQNTTEFRALIGEPRMGKIMSATVQEERDILNLTLKFVLRDNEPNMETIRPASLSQNSQPFHSLGERRGSLHGSQASLASDQASVGSDMKLRNIKKKKKVLLKEDTMSAENRQLLEEVGTSGRGQAEFLQRLLNEGADPNLVSFEGRPVLTLAVMNRHAAAISILVQAGANVDQPSGLINNTALHEAVELGAQGVKCVEALLACNASLKKRNDRGMTAQDLAVAGGNDCLVTLFASHFGQSLLEKLTQAKPASAMKQASLEVF
ncbi:double zinc ribbon and ankyrin repeat-containing protein 1 isoform X1 [Lethenteron reissneri]|uniref:double zinc ribbon and ankyrin repeat-containing protein 1 isoform X1 n=1 Tax=Lethenteron reissneri TaxID=7753 RepID=UPI002AB75A47|nr:double zinc ribbon and ankyrin repeat-containing protein 1 isoform X1 [Lethenteron reissneri]XP_061415418.1 double zinc ribbon and ankyrin repeat-containing protein 1 isoform X1 [Lethenteron reissneri]